MSGHEGLRGGLGMVHGDLIYDGKLGTRKGSAELVEIRRETAQGAPV